MKEGSSRYNYGLIASSRWGEETIQTCEICRSQDITSQFCTEQGNF